MKENQDHSEILGIRHPASSCSVPKDELAAELKIVETLGCFPSDLPAEERSQFVGLIWASIEKGLSPAGRMILQRPVDSDPNFETL